MKHGAKTSQHYFELKDGDALYPIECCLSLQIGYKNISQSIQSSWSLLINTKVYFYLKKISTQITQ